MLAVVVFILACVSSLSSLNEPVKYVVVLVSAVQQSESAVCICISPPSKTSPDNPTPLDHHRASR